MRNTHLISPEFRKLSVPANKEAAVEMTYLTDTKSVSDAA